ncbi:MAG: hypothetical protein F2795_06665 [Actinobacteria bacterium]|nr:hypothetical protein [Actinomycetota bacterium]
MVAQSWCFDSAEFGRALQPADVCQNGTSIGGAMSTEEKTKTTSRAATRRKKLIGGLGAAVVLAAVVVTIVSVAGGSGSRSGTLMTINGVQYDIATGANLAGADLSGANFTNVDLSGANLTGANLNNATLTGAKFGCIPVNNAQKCANFTNLKASGIIGTPAPLPAKWVLKSGFLLGPTVNLSGLSFQDSTILASSTAPGIDLTGANLRGTNLKGAALANAILTNADLTGALARNSETNSGSFQPTTFFAVIWNNTTCVNGSNSNSTNNTCVNIGY